MYGTYSHVKTEGFPLPRPSLFPFSPLSASRGPGATTATLQKKGGRYYPSVPPSSAKNHPREEPTERCTKACQGCSSFAIRMKSPSLI